MLKSSPVDLGLPWSRERPDWWICGYLEVLLTADAATQTTWPHRRESAIITKKQLLFVFAI